MWNAASIIYLCTGKYVFILLFLGLDGGISYSVIWIIVIWNNIQVFTWLLTWINYFNIFDLCWTRTLSSKSTYVTEQGATKDLFWTNVMEKCIGSSWLMTAHSVTIWSGSPFPCLHSSSTACLSILHSASEPLPTVLQSWPFSSPGHTPWHSTACQPAWKLPRTCNIQPASPLIASQKPAGNCKLQWQPHLRWQWRLLGLLMLSGLVTWCHILKLHCLGTEILIPAILT